MVLKTRRRAHKICGTGQRPLQGCDVGSKVTVSALMRRGVEPTRTI